MFWLKKQLERGKRRSGYEGWLNIPYELFKNINLYCDQVIQ